MQQRMNKMFDDMLKQRLVEVMPPQQTAMPPPVILSAAEQEVEEYHSQRRHLAATDMNRQRRYSAASADQFPNYVSPRQHVFDQPQLQQFDQFSTGQLQQQIVGMGGMHTNRPAFDNMSVVSAMVNNFANARTLDRLQRNVEDYRQREDQYRERELLDKLTQDITRFGGVYRG